LAHINALPLIKDCLEVARGDNSSIYGNGMVISVRVLYCILRICKDCNREICDYVIAASGTEDVDLPPGSTIPPENYNIRFLIDVASSESTSIEDLDFQQIAVSDFLLVNKILAGSKLNHGKYYLYTQVCAATMSVTAT
jgi:hypothetical protein